MSVPLIPQPSDLTNLEKEGFIIGSLLKKGEFTTVHTAQYSDPQSANPAVTLACKTYYRHLAPHTICEKFLPREVDILKDMNIHPAVLSTFCIMERGSRLFIFMRLAERGDLLDFINDQGPLPEDLSQVWFRQMVDGLQFMHEALNVAHRDIKCENVLLTKHWNVKLADFDFCRKFAEGDPLSQTYCGTPVYCAPEVIGGRPYDPKLSDVWSLGVVLYVMLNAILPFSPLSIRKLHKEQLAREWECLPVVGESLSQTVKEEVLPGILEPDVKRRVTLRGLADLGWVKDKPVPTGSGISLGDDGSISIPRVATGLLITHPTLRSTKKIDNLLTVNSSFSLFQERGPQR